MVFSLIEEDFVAKTKKETKAIMASSYLTEKEKKMRLTDFDALALQRFRPLFCQCQNWPYFVDNFVPNLMRQDLIKKF